MFKTAKLAFLFRAWCLVLIWILVLGIWCLYQYRYILQGHLRAYVGAQEFKGFFQFS